MRKKTFRILMLIVLLCLGIMNYFHNQNVYPIDLSRKTSTYTGRCINVETEIVRVARLIVMYTIWCRWRMVTNSGSTVLLQEMVMAN